MSANRHQLKQLVAAISGGFLLLHTHAAFAACDNFTPDTGETATCDDTAPNPVDTPVQAQPGSTDVTINILPGAVLQMPRSTANAPTRVEDDSQISNAGTVMLTGGGSSGLNRGAGLLGLGDNNTLTNEASGVISNTGSFNDGMAADGAGNTLINHGSISTTGPNAYGMTASWGQSGGGQPNNTLINHGSIQTSGSNARGMSILGGNGLVENHGSVTTTGNSSPGVYIQGANGHFINSGIVHAQGGAASGGRPSDGVFSNTLGASFTATIENLAGGQIISDQGPAIRTLNGATSITNAGLLSGGNGNALEGGNGDIDFLLQTGSQIIGLSNGGAGSNQVRLEGSGEIDSTFMNFQTLRMQGEEWVWHGDGEFEDAFVETGTLAVGDQNNVSATLIGGSISVAAGAFLGGYGTIEGAVINDGTITVANALPLFSSGPNGDFTVVGSLLNNNHVQIGGEGIGNNLVVMGNYVGAGGSMSFNTFVEGDGSPSDKLIISGGNASGSTGFNITNIGGGGAHTTGNGIMLVEAVDGGTTSGGAFQLNHSVAAGAYEYFLFRGGITDGTADNWYLRNTVVAPPAPTPENPDPSPAPQPSPSPGLPMPPPALGGDSPPPPPTPGAKPHIAEVIPLFRIETPAYSVVPPAARQMGLATLGTFHERQGEQSLLRAGGAVSALWVRGFRQNIDRDWRGTAAPTFDGELDSLQLGLDLYSFESGNKHRNHAGLFIGRARMDGDIRGFALGWDNLTVGHLDLEGDHVGGYWTHVGPEGWYLDGVLVYTSYDGHTRSSRGLGVNLDGDGFAASIEGGYPYQLTERWVLEPQAQLIGQRISLDNREDMFSSVRFHSNTSTTGRLGARFQGRYQRQRDTVLMPYLKLNVWHDFSDRDKVTLGGTGIITRGKSTALEVGLGLVVDISETVSVYGVVDYTEELDGRDYRVVQGNLGFRIAW